MENPFRRLSKAPTNPVHHSHAARTGGLGGSSAEAGGSGDPQISPSAAKRKAFDVEDLYRGPLLDVSEDSGELDLDEKLRSVFLDRQYSNHQSALTLNFTTAHRQSSNSAIPKRA